MASTAHVAAAALNQTVGDWSGNVRRAGQACQQARERGARLLVLPELCLSGYSLGDRVLRPGTLTRSWDALRALGPHTGGMLVFAGLPVRHRGVLYNAVAALADGEVVGLCAKENLAAGDCEYENRWYAGWPRGRVETFEAPDGARLPMGSLLFDAPGLGRVGVEICEDAWQGSRPGSVLALAGARVVVNASATWFTLGKHAMRRRMVSQISEEDHCVYLMASLLGCDATRLVFDGASLIASDGRLLADGARFVFDRDVEVVDRVVDLGALDRVRAERVAWRQQVEALARGERGPMPQVVQVQVDLGTTAAPEAPTPYWQPPLSPAHSLSWVREFVARPPSDDDLPHLELELALCLGLRDYLRKTGLPGVMLALSGGRDSAMVAVLVARMLRYEHPDLDAEELRKVVARRFATTWMETDHSSEATRRAAAELARALGSRHVSTSIQQAYEAHAAQAATLLGRPLDWDEPTDDLALQNLQARLRAVLVWMLANLHGFLLLTTSNKSEAAVGYTTMDGDSAGGLAPLGDVPKSLIRLWLRWAADFHGIPALGLVLGQPPSAELRPLQQAQTDEDDLMPYEVLDRILQLFVQRGMEPLEVFHTLWPQVREGYGDDPRAFATHIRRFVRALCASQWKRERFAISFRVTAFDLDPKTGFRFPPVQAPFTEELAALDAWVDDLLATEDPR